MEKFQKNFNNALAKMKGWLVQASKKAQPVLQKGLNKAADTAKKGGQATKVAYEKAKPVVRRGVGRAFQKVSDACGRVAESMNQEPAKPTVSEEEVQETVVNPKVNAPEEPMPEAEEPTEFGEDEKTADDIEAEVEEQLAKIREAEQEPTIISDYVADKYGKDDE